MKHYCMRKSVFLLPGLWLLILTLAQAQDTNIYWRFNNAQYINNDSVLQFDVQVRSDHPATWMRVKSVFFNYNPDQFGENVLANGNITYDLVGLSGDPGVPGNPFMPLYVLANQADNSHDAYGNILQSNYPNHGGGDVFNWNGEDYPFNHKIPVIWTDYMRYMLNVADGSKPAGISFKASAMDGGQLWTDTFDLDPKSYAINGHYMNDLKNLTKGTMLELKAYLEGPYNTMTGMMNTELSIGDWLPVNQPYNTPPWNYPGSESIMGEPDENVVDWVLIELRETTVDDPATANQSTVIDRKAALISEDGQIVSVSGSPGLYFDVKVNDYLFVALYHRNHIAVLSNFALSMTNYLYSYDFSTWNGQVYGGSNAHVEVETGVWALMAGDSDANGQINNTDKNNVWKPQSGGSGYLMGDMNLNAQVDNDDKNLFWYPNSGGGSGVPISPAGGYSSFVND